MKRFTLFFSFSILLISQSLFAAAPSKVVNDVAVVPAAVVRAIVVQSVKDLIDWKVGEYTNYNIEFFLPGTLDKKVSGEEKGAVWVEEVMDFQGLGKTEVKVKLSRATAEILEYYVNGEKQEIPETPKYEIIDQEEEMLTVPAGTFKTIKVTLKDKESGEMTYIWINPKDVAMEGMVQMTAPTQFGEMTLKLTSFGGM